MGKGGATPAGSKEQKLSSSVRLNVYDLVESNNCVLMCGFGAFHTGVEVYEVEYAYGESPRFPPPLLRSPPPP
jgi:hypothetical protein